MPLKSYVRYFWAKKKKNKWSYNLSIFLLIFYSSLNEKSYIRNNIQSKRFSYRLLVSSFMCIQILSSIYQQNVILQEIIFLIKILGFVVFFLKLLQAKIIWSELNNKLCVSITKYPWNALNDPRNYIICTRNPIHLNLALKSNNINYRKPFKCVDYCFYFLFKEGV